MSFPILELQIRADRGFVELAARGDVASLAGAYISAAAPASAASAAAVPSNGNSSTSSGGLGALRSDRKFMLHLMEHVSPRAFEYCDENLKSDRAMVSKWGNMNR